MLTPKGKEVVVAMRAILDVDNPNMTITTAELAAEMGKKEESIRGRLGKLQKEGYIVSEEIEIPNPKIEGTMKKQKRLSLTDLGWEVDVDAKEEEDEE